MNLAQQIKRLKSGGHVAPDFFKAHKDITSIRRGWSRFSRVKPKLSPDQYLKRYRKDYATFADPKGLFRGPISIHNALKGIAMPILEGDFLKNVDVFGAELLNRLSPASRLAFDNLLKHGLKDYHKLTSPLWNKEFKTLPNLQKVARELFTLYKQTPSLFIKSGVLIQDISQLLFTSIGEFIIITRNTKYMKINKQNIVNLYKNAPAKREGLKRRLEVLNRVEVATTDMSSWITAVRYWPKSQMFAFKVKKWYPAFSMSRGVFYDYILNPGNTPGNGIGTFLWKTYWFQEHSSAFKQEREHQSLVEAERDRVVPQKLVQARLDIRLKNPLIIPILLTTPKKPQIQALKPHTIASNNLRAGLFRIQ